MQLRPFSAFPPPDGEDFQHMFSYWREDVSDEVFDAVLWFNSDESWKLVL